MTTPSLEALRKYADGSRATRYENDHMRAVTLLKEAVGLDSMFAMAWSVLAATYRDAGMPLELANDAEEHAYRHRDRLPDRERDQLVGAYFRRGPGWDRARAAEAYEAGLRVDTGFFANSLGLLYQPPSSICGTTIDRNGASGSWKRCFPARRSLPFRCSAPRGRRTTTGARRITCGAARLYAQARRPDLARTVLAQFDAEPRDTALRRASGPAVHSVLGEIALAEGRPLEALEEFRRADRLADGPVHLCAICPEADLGRAFDQAGMADSAIAAFERYLETPQWIRISLDAKYVPGILQRLGALYQARGDRTRAIAYYSRFVDLWRDADPELQPRVAEARRRIASLSQ